MIDIEQPNQKKGQDPCGKRKNFHQAQPPFGDHQSQSGQYIVFIKHAVHIPIKDIQQAYLIHNKLTYNHL